MLIACGLTTVLYLLKIPYTLSIITDSGMKVRIKEVDEPQIIYNFTKIFDYYFIKRNVT